MRTRDKMGKADLKVTVGLLVLGVAIGWMILSLSSGGLTVQSEHRVRPAALPSTIAPSQSQAELGGDAHPPATRSPAPSFMGDEELPPTPASQAPASPEDRRQPPRHDAMPLLQGNIMSISHEKRELAIGTYRIEQNRAVFASQQVIGLTDETAFVRGTPAPGGQVTEVAISSREVHAGDPVRIIPSTGRQADRIVAERIVVLDLPRPPGVN